MGTVRPQIVLFGDSNTEFSFKVEEGGWGALLANHYARKADVISRGFRGYNTRWALMIIDKIFPIHSMNPPLLVTVGLGANDAAVPDACLGVLSVPLDEYRENLLKIVSHLKSQCKSTHIVIISPPPVGEKALLNFVKETIDPTITVSPIAYEQLKLYAKESVKVAKETGVPFIDIWSTFQNTTNWSEKYLTDGIHYSAAGSAVLFEELVKVVDDSNWVPSLTPKEMPSDFPGVADIDFKNPAATFMSWTGAKKPEND